MADKVNNNRIANLERDTKQLTARIRKLEASLESIGELQHSDQTKPSTSMPIDNTRRAKETANKNIPILTRVWKTIATVHWVGIFTVLGVGAGVAVAFLTYLQWRSLKDNFEADERAWVKIDLQPPQLSEDASEVTMVAILTNVGKTPITHLYGIARIEVLDSDKTPNFDLSEHSLKNRTDSMMIFPSESRNWPLALTDQTTNYQRKLSSDEVAKFKAGKSYFATMALIVFNDGFGFHWSRYCGYQTFHDVPINSRFNAQSCVEWNHTGDGKPDLTPPHAPFSLVGPGE